MKEKQTLVVWERVEGSNQNNWDIGSEIYISIKFYEIAKLFRSTKEQKYC